MRRKRRSRGMWLPVLGTGLGDTDSMVFRDLAFPLDPTGETSVLIFPVTYDDPKDDDEQDAQSQLTEFVGQEYILNSIVGKCHVGYMATAANRDLEADQVPKFVGVAAGFFVARADGGAPGVDDVPIGASGGNATRRNYSPLSPDTMREPWIWHRSWLFCPPTPRAEHSFDPFINGVSGTAGIYSCSWPSSNAQYGSVMDGPHIHTKTRRHVRQDERLWFAIAGIALDGPYTEPGAQAQIAGMLQVRINARLVKAHNRSAF